MKLGPFIVGNGGRLTLCDAEADPAFSFLWRSRCFAVRVLTDRLTCAVPVGRLPSSVAGAARRDAAVALLRALGRQLPAGWHLSLLPDHRIQLEAGWPMHWPTTAASLITPLFQLLMRAAPLLDILDEAGLA